MMMLFYVHWHIKNLKQICSTLRLAPSSVVQCISFKSPNTYMNAMWCLASFMDEHRLYLNGICISFEYCKPVFDHFIFLQKMKHYDFQ